MTYPIFVNLKGVHITIVGGGRIACRKIENILDQGALIKVVAPNIINQIKTLAESDENITLIEEKFQTDHLNDSSLVFLTSDDEIINKEVNDFCVQKGILVNNCMDSSKSTFRNGAVIRRGELEIAIASGGKRPGISKWIKDMILDRLPEQLDEVIIMYDQVREQAKEKFNNSKDREVFVRNALKEYLETLEGQSHED